jgi:hypothetical protein
MAGAGTRPEGRDRRDISPADRPAFTRGTCTSRRDGWEARHRDERRVRLTSFGDAFTLQEVEQ